MLDVTYFSDSNKTIDFQLSCGGDTIFDTQYHNSLHFPIQRYCSGSLDYAVSGVTATDISLNLTTVSRDISIPVDATIVSSSGSYTQMQPDNNTSVGGVLVDIRAYLMVLLILTIAVSFTSILIWCL